MMMRHPILVTGNTRSRATGCGTTRERDAEGLRKGQAVMKLHDLSKRIALAARASVAWLGGRSGTTAFALVIPIAVFFFVPWSPTPLATFPYDAAYTPMASLQFAAGSPWGVATAHLSGPWGFVRFPVFAPETLGLSIAVDVTLSVALALLIYRTLLEGRVAPILAAVATAIQLALLSLTDDSAWLFVFFVQLLVVPDFRARRTTFPFALATMLSAFATTVKGTFLLCALGVQTAILLLEISAWRKPLNSALWLLALAAFLAAARVGPIDFIHHFRHVLGSLGGYAESFSLPGTLAQTLLVAMSSALLLLAVGLLEARSRGRFALFTVAAYAAVLWIAYKAAVVRPDWTHITRTFYVLVAFGCTLSLAKATEIKELVRGKSAEKGSATVALASLMAAAAVLCYWFATGLGSKSVLDHVAALANAAPQVLRHGFAATAHRDKEAKAQIRRQYPLPEEVGDEVGVFGTFQTPVIAYGKRNVPLPVAAHYEVWTPQTIAATNEFLRSANAPKYLLYTATNQSASNAITLAEYYEPIANHDLLTVLRRREVPLRASEQQVIDRDATWDEVVPIPPEIQGHTLVAKITYNRTLLNRLTSVAYQPPRVYLVLYDERGPYAKIRLNRLILEDGVVLSAGRGTWDGLSGALHSRRHAILTTPVEPSCSGFALTVEGPLGAQRARGYFARRLHVRVDEISFK